MLIGRLTFPVCTSQVHDSCQSHGSISDWRGELLLAYQCVFVKERSALLATFQTELTSLNTTDANELLNSLEQRIHEQVSKQNYFQESFLNSKKMWIIDFLWSLDLHRKLSI